MTIRERTVTDTPTITRKNELRRIVVTESGTVMAHWRVIKRGETEPSDMVVEISQALANNLAGRSGWQLVLDMIEADTFPRTGAA